MPFFPFWTAELKRQSQWAGQNGRKRFIECVLNCFLMSAALCPRDRCFSKLEVFTFFKKGFEAITAKPYVYSLYLCSYIRLAFGFFVFIENGVRWEVRGYCESFFFFFYECFFTLQEIFCESGCPLNVRFLLKKGQCCGCTRFADIPVGMMQLPF